MEDLICCENAAQIKIELDISQRNIYNHLEVILCRIWESI